jgi:hypothetical protein
MVLVVGLIILSVLTVIGATAMITSSTDLKISGNYKTGAMSFYASEAGIEEARARLKLGSPNLIADSQPTNAGWNAFIGTDSKAQGRGYNSGNSLHTRVASLQSALDYTVRIVHQTNSAGQVLYWGDANVDGRYERNATAGQSIYLATSFGASGGAQKNIVVEMARMPPITVPGALYVNAPTSLLGNANVDGRDHCGTSATDVPGIVSSLAPGSVSLSNNSSVTGTGTSPSIEYNHTFIDVQTMIDAQKGNANYAYNVVSATHTGMSWGTPTMGATLADASSCSATNVVHYNTRNSSGVLTDVKLAGGTTGCGILLVEGDLDINGGFAWHGIVLVSGSVKYTGGGDKNVTGGILAGGTIIADVIGGNTNIVYCGTAINNQTNNRPLVRLSWLEQL